MLNLGYGVFNATGGGGGFTPAYYTPSSYTGGWSSPENAYDGSGVATGVQSTIDMSSCTNGNYLFSDSSVSETYSFASVTGFSQIQINGTYDYELTSAATQYTTGSEDPFYQGYVTGTAQFVVEVSTDGGSNFYAIELVNCNTLPPPLSPSGQTISGSSQSFNATIISSTPQYPLPADLSSLKIRLRSYVTANAYRNSDGVLYSASGVSDNAVYNMTVYVS